MKLFYVRVFGKRLQRINGGVRVHLSTEVLVILKFHFWNGDILTYKITKSGTSIVGKSS
ncbi:hypothetical protein [Paenibacillus pseudetheri]|uniref:hypothetical protein n=1 Tax=Paenibacillus pseudetheri TaxID=2897682 RepID=UPI002434521B|nr:hypothetical protein [Paenibacillus pseudetheri]